MKDENARAVLWDLDGTVLDSRELHWDAWRVFAGQHGRPMDYDFFSETFGFRNEIILRRHFGDKMTDDEVQQYSVDKETLYRDLMLRDGVRPLPGVVEWMQWADEHGWRQALASMAPRVNIDATLRALRLPVRFQSVVSAEEVRHGKPDPEVFLLAAERLGVAPARCTVIEDSLQGVQAAKRAGMRCIGVGPIYRELPADVKLPALAGASPELLEDNWEL